MLILLTTTVLVVVNNSRFQHYLAEKVSEQATDALGVPVSVERISLGHYLRFELHNLLVLDHQMDTLASARQLNIRLSEINTPKRILRFSDVMAEELRFGLITHPGDTIPNLTVITERLKDTTKKESAPWTFQIGSASLRNCRFLLENRNKAAATEGMDFNYLDADRINARIDKFRVEDDTIYADIKHLSTREKSGFFLQQFTSDFRVSSTGITGDYTQIFTPQSTLYLDFDLDYNDYDDFSDFISKVQIEADIRRSKLALDDLRYFAPQVSDLNTRVGIEGSFFGSVDDLYARDIDIQYGEKTRYEGFLRISGLPHVKDVSAKAMIKRFYITKSDLNAFLRSQEGDVRLPNAAGNIEYAEIEGDFEGRLNDFYSEAMIETNLGSVWTDLRMWDTLDNRLFYNGHLSAESLDIGRLFNMEDDFGEMNLSTEINGQGVEKEDLIADVNGYINKMEFRGNTYDSIRVIGMVEGQRFGGKIRIADEYVNLDFEGNADFSSENAAFRFDAEIDDAYLVKLRVSNREDIESRLSAKISADFISSNVDSISGEISLSELTYHQDNFIYTLDSLHLAAQQQQPEKTIKINSDFLDGIIKGDFRLSELGDSFMDMMAYYLPSLGVEQDSAHHSQQFGFDFILKDTKGLSYIFMPELLLAPKTHLGGSYMGDNYLLDFHLNSDSVVYNSIRFEDVRLQSRKDDSLFELTTKVKNVIFKDGDKEKDEVTLGLERLSFSNRFKNDSLNYTLRWDDFEDTDANKAYIEGHLGFREQGMVAHRITRSEVKVNDSLWRINPQNELLWSDTTVVIRNMFFNHENQRFGVDGIISNNPKDSLSVAFDSFDISAFNMILETSGMNLEGVINGNLTFSDLRNRPRFNGSLGINNLYFNHEKLGDMSLQSSWNDSTGALQLASDIIYKGRSGKRDLLNLEGEYYPNVASGSDSINISTNLKNLQIAVLEPFFDDFLSEIKGWASGDLTLKGSSSKPELTGNIGLVRSGVRVSFLNTKYYLADEIKLQPDAIVFDSIVLYDTLGNEALLNGKVQHRYFDDFYLDIHISPQRFAGLNTDRSHNELFYGKAFATGAVDITGPLSDIRMNVKARPTQNTNIVIPISTAESVAENDFITFINTEEKEQESVVFDQTNSSGFNLDFQLDINPNASAEIILPFQMGNIKGRGSGNMRMEINSSGEFNMFGDYNIEEGLFVFKLQNLLRNEFVIRRGASISWSGDPYDADVNITAVYRARPTLKVPAVEAIDPELANERVPVDCVITLKNKLFNPTIDFNIELPSADSRVKELVYGTIVDTTSTAEMNKQMLYLLVLNSFSASGMDNSLSSGLGAQSFELLSNQISSWLSQISKDVDIGVNYRPGDSYTSEELEVALSTQLFNNRLSIDGSFGMTGMQEQTNTNTIVGDVNVELKITRDGRFRVRAFNRTNNTDLLDIDAPYTQGVGIFYRKEFDSLSELFRKKRAREVNQ